MFYTFFTSVSKYTSQLQRAILFITMALSLSHGTNLLAEGKKILYIGDSITDGNWGGCGSSSDRNLFDMNHIFGHGYMFICAAYYMSEFPEKNYSFYNRGISGNTLVDLEKRWEKDVLEIHPDVLSVLIGINDVHSYLESGESKEFDFESWEKIYRSLLDRAITENPHLQLVLGTPFVFQTGSMKENPKFDKALEMVLKLKSRVEKIAIDYNAVCLPYFNLFEQLIHESKSLSDTYWIWDGIHPTPAGHHRMAKIWMESVDSKHLLD